MGKFPDIESNLSLVFGSGLSTYTAIEDEILSGLRKRFNLPDDCLPQSVDEFVNATFEHGVAQDYEIRSYIVECYKIARPNSVLENIAKIHWSAIVSLTVDMRFYESLVSEFDSVPLSRVVTKINDLKAMPSYKQLPYYCLLGDIGDLRVDYGIPITTAEYLIKRRKWSALLQTFPDFNKGGAILFVGTSGIVEIVRDFINELANDVAGVPRNIYFLADDPISNDQTIRGLLDLTSNVHVLDCTLIDFFEHIKIPTNKKLVSINKSNFNFDKNLLDKVDDKISRVPLQSEINVDAYQRNKLLDYLFRPTNLDWAPFSHNLDFRRECAEKFREKIEAFLDSAKQSKGKAFWLYGEAGIGKTVFLRRTAFDLANKGYLCLWIRRGAGYVQPVSWRDVVKTVEQAIKNNKNPKVIFFYDGALKRDDNITELLEALNASKLTWALVICQRKTDYSFDEEVHELLDHGSDENIEFEPFFSDEEQQRLPEYLVKLGAAKSSEDAASLLQSVGGKGVEDTLCAFWYLLPQTRASISDSLADEYFNLGGLEGAIETLAQASVTSKDWARFAYELVTTTSGMMIALPIEVMVKALDINYDEWLEVSGSHKPLWGLLYDEEYADGESRAYRTRNIVVTNVLLTLLNGGKVGHAGEFRCLKKIISACYVGSVVYRELLCSVLVANKKQLKDKFSYEQGLELYDLAIHTFPLPDKTIAHHRALWIKDVGRLPVEAYESLSQVIKMEDYPHSNKKEHPSHIHSSMASSTVQAIFNGDVELESGIENVEKHITLSDETAPFNIHNKHISANLLLKIAHRYKLNDAKSYMRCVGQASSIISQAIMIVKPNAKRSRESYKSYEMLDKLRKQTYMLTDNLEESMDLAKVIYSNRGDQMGFYAIIKVMLSQAIEHDKGKLFKRMSDYLTDVIKIILESGDELSPHIVQCRAELVINWNIQKNSSDTDWGSLRDDLLIVTASREFKRDINWRFFLGVCYFQLGELSDANTIFSMLRREKMPIGVRNELRCFYTDSKNHKKTFQGEISGGATSTRFIYCSEINEDISAAREFTENDEATVHFNIAFNYYGPRGIPLQTS